MSNTVLRPHLHMDKFLKKESKRRRRLFKLAADRFLKKTTERYGIAGTIVCGCFAGYVLIEIAFYFINRYVNGN